jgi:hypothetical protein
VDVEIPETRGTNVSYREEDGGYRMEVNNEHDGEYALKFAKRFLQERILDKPVSER